jgi:amidase
MDTTRRMLLKSGGSALALGAAGSVMTPEVPAAIAQRSTGSADPLCFMSARELADLIRERKVSAREVMAAHLAQIARVNPKLNAIVAKLDDDRCTDCRSRSRIRSLQSDFRLRLARRSTGS